MPKLLRIDVSPRGDWSISKNVADAVVAEWKSKYNGDVTVRDISKGLPIVDLPWIAGAYSSPDQQTEEHKAALKISDELIDELQAADHILIATPFWNFTIPAALMSWIDQVVRFNKTFTASYEGLVKNKKVYVVCASGGAYEDGDHMEKYNNFSKPLTDILGFIGMTDLNLYMAKNTRDVMQGKITSEQYLADHSKAAISKLLA